MGIENFPDQEKLDQTVITKNLKLMDDEMLYEIGAKFVGIEIAEIKGKTYGCARVHGFLNQNTGEIINFQTEQSVPREIKQKFILFYFNVAHSFKYGRYGFFKITEFKAEKTISDQAKATIKESIHKWNKNHNYIENDIERDSLLQEPPSVSEKINNLF